MAHIDLREINFKQYYLDQEPDLRPSEAVLDAVYELGLTTFQREMPHRTGKEIERLMGGRTLFLARMIDPNNVEDGQLNPNQSFEKPVLSVAYTGKDIEQLRLVGYASSANNVSGNTETIRRAKIASGIKNYRWLKTIAVLPELQGRGIGSALAIAAFSPATRLQPASAYTFPEDSTAGDTVLASWGLKETGDQIVDAFGTGENVLQRRYAHERARGIVDKIAGKSPGVFTLEWTRKLNSVKSPTA